MNDKEINQVKAKFGDTVSVHFTCKVEDGTVYDSTAGKEPIKFTIGEGKFIEGFENSIVGMYPGESKTVHVTSDHAYGHHDDEKIKFIARQEFPGDIPPEIGMQLHIKRDDGGISYVSVTAVDESKVTLDANHPLAGKDLTFDLELVNIVKSGPNANGYYWLGSYLQDHDYLDEAIANYAKAVQIDPNFAAAYYSLGVALQQKNQFEEAMAFYQQALSLNPKHIYALNNLGHIFKKMKKYDEAITYYQKALEINPDYADTYNNLGAVLQEKGMLEESIAYYENAVRVKEDFVEAYLNLGNAFKEEGQLQDAEKYFRHALKIKPDSPVAHSCLLMLLNYFYEYDPETVFNEHIEYAKKFGETLSSGASSHKNSPEPDRRLKIGYISPDFKRHSVTSFFEPVVSAHNREDFEIYCYSDVSIPDEVTKHIENRAGNWRNIIGMSDEGVEQLIRNDEIDILVDLAGHTANNRMLVFARKPAPVQASWIGYPATTGLSMVDYKIVDSYTDPPGMTEKYYAEKLLRLPGCFLCYNPDGESPEVSSLPAIEKDYITFGSFNNFTKVSTEVLGLWIQILKDIPNSHFIMKSYSFSDVATRQRALEKFVHEGIAVERIEILPAEPSTKKHLSLYNCVDIGLDTFPYNGTTTTCEALWMGVPVIVLAGKTHASRVGVSLLSNIGLTEHIAETRQEYRTIAVGLARNMDKLQEMRKKLRDTIAGSPLTNAARFTSILEKGYREIWNTWCETQ